MAIAPATWKKTAYISNAVMLGFTTLMLLAIRDWFWVFTVMLPLALNVFTLHKREELPNWSDAEILLRQGIYLYALGSDVMTPLFLLKHHLINFISLFFIFPLICAAVCLMREGPVKSVSQLLQSQTEVTNVTTTRTKHIFGAVLIPPFALAFYALVGLDHGVFVPSASWAGIGAPLSFGLAAIFVCGVAQSYKSGLIMPRRWTPAPGFFVYISAFCLLSLVFWLAIVFGFGRLTTILSPTEKQVVYNYSLMRRHYGYVHPTEARTFGKFNFQPEDFSALPVQGVITVQAMETWFGRRLTGYYLHENLRSVSEDYEGSDFAPPVMQPEH